MELLLAFLDDEYTVIKVGFCDGLSCVGYFFAIKGNTALLYCSTSIAVTLCEFEFAEKADKAFSFAGKVCSFHLCCRNVCSCCTATRECCARCIKSLLRFFFAVDELCYFKCEYFLCFVYLGALKCGEALNLVHRNEGQHAEAFVHVGVANVSPVLEELVRATSIRV